MNVYYCLDHQGHYPIGVCSVVVAKDIKEATRLLNDELHSHGLHKNEPFTLRKLNIDYPYALVLRDGDY